MEQNVGGWAVSGSLEMLRVLRGGVAGRSFLLSAGAAMTTKVLRVPCERSKVREESST